MMSHLNINDIRSIFIWLKEHGQEFDAGKMHREFSDGVKVAKILKSVYPRLVDMNNYPKCNNTVLKIKNWETLNYKVLRKIGLHINGKRINKLAKCKPGAIESLLQQIMVKEIEYRRENDTSISLQEQIWTENDDVLTVNIKKMVDGEIKEVPEKLILFSIYDEAVKKSQQLSSKIQALSRKVEHLENLKILKLQRINEIIERCINPSYDPLKELAPQADIPPLDLREVAEKSSDSSTTTETGEAQTN